MRVLIIGAMGGQIGAASQMAMSRGAKVAHAEDLDRAMRYLRDGQGAELVMIDVKQDVADFMERLTAERINVPVVACGIGNDTEAAVRAIKAGAKEYVPLPPDADLIAAVLAAVAEEDHHIVFADPVMNDLLRMAEKLARSDASLLITGPSGTGKELLARHVHTHSPRKKARFVAVNCAAIPENLLESELFGHEKGAFTGAVGRRIGKFEEADGGTLLLDEVSEMELRLQAKLLRAIQEREIDRVGGTKPVTVNTRIIATSNRNLQEVVAQGTFREDLFFRLNVVVLPVPALKDRPLNIPILARHFAKGFAEDNDMEFPTLSDGALRKLEAYSWPGNVRELENTMHRTVLLAEGSRIGPDDVLLTGEGMTPGGQASSMPASADGQAVTARLVGHTVAEVERDLIIDTLHHCLGNRTHASHILGISIRTLRNKLKQYGEQGFAVPAPGVGVQPSA